MNDRVSLNPGRVLVTPENGGEAFYATLTRADNPTQEGDPLCKNTLLKDATAALLGGNENMLPDDAFLALKNLFDEVSGNSMRAVTGTYVGTGTTEYSLTFPLPVKLLIILAGSGIAWYTGSSNQAGIQNGTIWVDGLTASYAWYQSSGGASYSPATMTYAKSSDGKTLNITGTKATYNTAGCNNLNTTYKYFALCRGD